MKVFFHDDFYQVYTSDPASKEGRMEAVVEVINPVAEFITAEPASESDILAVHTESHVNNVRYQGLYSIAALAAGGAVQAAELGLVEPCFALVRPPGHHASQDTSWGFCYFNNMAIAIASLKNRNKIKAAYILDIDLHYGDGNVNILEDSGYVTIYNVETNNRNDYLEEVSRELENCHTDIIGVSAGFDNHREDWGGLLETRDYYNIGKNVRAAAKRCHGGCFAILEGGYNHDVLGQNVLALIKGMSDD